MYPLALVKDELCERDQLRLTDLMEERVQEDLCDNCYALRTSGIKLTKLKEWTERANPIVAWIKIKLEFENLISTLQKLYLEYLHNFDNSKPQLIEI